MGPGSESKLFEHATKIYEEGKLQLALHMLDVIIKGTDPNNTEILLEAYELKRNILKKKANAEHSFIVKNILNNGAVQLKAKIKELREK